MIRQIEQFLLAGERELLEAINERDWETIEPVLHSAKWLLFPNASLPDRKSAQRRHQIGQNFPLAANNRDNPLHLACDNEISMIMGLTLRRIAFSIALVVSIVATVYSAGFATPVVAGVIDAALIAMDVALVGLEAAYLLWFENPQRQRINRIAVIDYSLSAAQDEESVTRAVGWNLLFLLGPPVAVTLVRSARNRLLARAVRNIPLPNPSGIAEETVEATSRARRSVTRRDQAGESATTRPGSGRPTGEEASLSQESRATPARQPPQGAMTRRGQAGETATTRPGSGRPTGEEASLSQESRATPARQPSQGARAVANEFDDDFERAIVETAGVDPIPELPPPPLDRFDLPEAQKETFGAFLDRLFTDHSASPVHVRNPRRQALLQQSFTRAANLRARLQTHWDGALPRRGTQSLAEAVLSVLQRLRARTATTVTENQWIRRALFNLWRRRFIKSVARDHALVRDLESQAGIIFNLRPGRGGNAFSIPAIDHDGGRVLVGLDVDHGVIRHEDAVRRALQTGDASHLESTVDSSNLQMMTARQNQTVIETLRRHDREMWSAPPQTPPPSVTPPISN